MSKVHYIGGLRIVSGDSVDVRHEGWPACGNGMAHTKGRWRLVGSHTKERNAVTCKKCLKLLKKAGK